MTLVHNCTAGSTGCGEVRKEGRVVLTWGSALRAASLLSQFVFLSPFPFFLHVCFPFCVLFVYGIVTWQYFRVHSVKLGND
jgi:hypothetical protein